MLNGLLPVDRLPGRAPGSRDPVEALKMDRFMNEISGSGKRTQEAGVPEKQRRRNGHTGRRCEGVVRP